MKKILMGMIALMLIAGTSFASDKNKPAAKEKAKTACSKTDCKDKKDCKAKTACTKPCKPSSCVK
jgi:hypothetical protein